MGGALGGQVRGGAGGLGLSGGQRLGLLAPPLALALELACAEGDVGTSGAELGAERGALGLEHREAHRLAGARELAGAQVKAPLAGAGAQLGHRVQRAAERLAMVLRARLGPGEGGAGLGGRGGGLAALDLRGQRVALGAQRLHAALELGAPQLQDLDGLQRLGGDAGLGALGGLGLAGATLREHGAVDDLAALVLGGHGRRRLGRRLRRGLGLGLARGGRARGRRAGGRGERDARAVLPLEPQLER